MIFAVFIGLMLGLRSVEPTAALIILMVALGLKLLLDVRWDRVPFLDSVSPYVVYRYNLAQAGEPTKYAWISYALQLFLFGGLFGATVYAVVSLFMS